MQVLKVFVVLTFQSDKAASNWYHIIRQATAMVEQNCLASMDGLIWLRTGHHVASKFNLHQTTVSRNSRKCAKTFEISLERVNSEWQVIGDPKLLNLERKVHQYVRFKSDNCLRLDAQHWSGSLLATPPPSGWILGNLNFLEYQRPLQLMQERIIDAWITSYPDTPSHDPDIATIRLSKMPMVLVVNAGHPLLELGDAVRFKDVSGYPMLPLPDHAFPKFEQTLRACGLSLDPSQSERQSHGTCAGQGPIEDLMVGFATPLTLPLYGESWQALPLRLPIEVGDALVVRREFSDYPQIQRLADYLRERLTELALTTPDLAVLTGHGSETGINNANSLDPMTQSSIKAI